MRFLYVLVYLCLLTGSSAIAQNRKIDYWLTRSDRSVLFTQQAPLEFGQRSVSGQVITVDDSRKYQSIDGFGFALTGGSAQHIVRMSATARAALLKELFATDGNNIGISYIRLSIGASDLNEKIFSYNDLPPGETDTAMEKFDLGPDREDVIPVMKEILQIVPSLKILASPWSPPVWMKTNHDTRGGQLIPEYYRAYAKYFVKYVQQMKAEGITIDAITVQNEPLHPGNNPSLLMTAPDQAEFVRNHLGPLFKENNIKTKIIVYDHNANRPDYPVKIYEDPEAAKYIDGSGFHLYAGNIEALTDVHEAYPDKHIYFTEQMVVERPGRPGINIASPVQRLIIGATRNWSRNVLEWNLAADPEYKPYTDRGGCDMCQGAVTIDKDSFSRNIAYYSIAHASKFVRPGSVRIGSNETDSLSTVAFINPAGKHVLIVSNNSNQKQIFNIKFKNRIAVTKLEGGDVATYVW
ncbi:MAG: glucosylceramidase [Chitinophagaceae bacterium]|nr:glucosylceramidase [Chitinophagaceae bacterium]